MIVRTELLMYVFCSYVNIVKYREGEGGGGGGGGFGVNVLLAQFRVYEAGYFGNR